MRIWLDLPDGLVEQLAQKSQDLSRSAEALAVDAYRMNRMTRVTILPSGSSA
ncbi:MAG: hypothetical protein ACRD2I_14875 [Vicinamibacterales bacterium]